jgi:hypothetical protein
MPRTLRQTVQRMNIRIPKPMMDEVEKIVSNHPELYNNRQQFIESSIREKIERLGLMGVTTSQQIDDNLLGRIKETFLAHIIINNVKENSPPDHHTDLKQLEQYIRRHIMKIAEQEGRNISQKRLDELTKAILDYHTGIVEGLALMASQ